MAEMKVFPYEKQAMAGDPLPSGLGYPDQILYLSLSLLYYRLRNEIVTREEAMLEKKELIEQYRCYQYREQMGQQWVEVIRETEMARAAYLKDRTLENADKLVEIIEGRKFNGANM